MHFFFDIAAITKAKVFTPVPLPFGGLRPGFQDLRLLFFGQAPRLRRPDFQGLPQAFLDRAPGPRTCTAFSK